MSSSYRINAAGDLLGVKMKVVGKPNLADWLKMVQENINVSIAGEVIEGKLAPHVTVSLSDVEEKRQVPEIEKRIEMLQEIKVPRGGTVLPRCIQRIGYATWSKGRPGRFRCTNPFPTHWAFFEASTPCHR
jgi:hypothetical protein